MPSLSGVVRQELRRYSDKLCKALAGIHQRGPVTKIEHVTAILSEVHALFEDDFLDRLEPSGWIQPLLESSLVAKSAQLIDCILQTYFQAKDAGLFSVAAVSGDHVKRYIWAQLVALEILQAAFPIQWAVQAVQIEALSTPVPQRLGGRLLEHLSSASLLQALADATRFVKEELWTAVSDGSARASPICDFSSKAEATTDDTARRRRGVLDIFGPRLDRVLGNAGGGGHGSDAAGAAGARVLTFVAQHLSCLSASFEEDQLTEPHGSASIVPALTKLLASLTDSGVLTALCAAVLSAPPGTSPPRHGDAVADDFTMTIAEVQLTTCMALWDISALVAAYGTPVAALLAAPEVLQLRRAALEQLVDVIHILVDAAVGAVNMSQDFGARAASTAAEQLFPSRFGAADLTMRVCRALYGHAAAGDPKPMPGRGSSPWQSPYMSAGGGGSTMAASSRSTSSGGTGGGGGSGGLSLQQRIQLADDGSSVEIALRIRMLHASPAELHLCAPAVVSVRGWVQRLAAAAAAAAASTAGSTAAAGASTNAASQPGLTPHLAVEEESPAPSQLSSPSSADGTTLYGDDHSPTPYPATGHEDHLTSLEGDLQQKQRCSPMTVRGGGGAAAAAAAASPADSPTPVAAQAGTQCLPIASEHGPSVATARGSKQKTKSAARRIFSSSTGQLPGQSGSVSAGPSSPVRQSRRLSDSLRRSFERLRNWVSSRRSHEAFAAPADLEAEAVLPVRVLTPLRHGSAPGGSGGGVDDKSRPRMQTVPSALLHSDSGAATPHAQKYLLSSPPPQPAMEVDQQVPRSYPGTPPCAQPPPPPPRYMTTTAPTSIALGTPPRPPPSSGGGVGSSNRLRAAASPSSTFVPSPSTRLAPPAAIDIIARVPVVHSPGHVYSVGGYLYGSSAGGYPYGNSSSTGGGGTDRLISGGRILPAAQGLSSPGGIPTSTPPTSNGFQTGSESPGAVRGLGIAGGACPAKGHFSAVVAATAAAAPTVQGLASPVAAVPPLPEAPPPPRRRSVLRSGVLTAPLRLLRRRHRRDLQMDAEGCPLWQGQGQLARTLRL
ncbi:hypothetical protein VOLCADRAFT_92271 [Volvox carteri f. nagariensis]|uniref:Uncharacterized protein n=1 Tax=Volvox carteri f. nagariensis TaxID=3068 RepID=D8TZ79_VOLCA|nr:uncharacterized protein VOLCADRAFT_92271 [Volvox carteri f. nagariensis]EFJ47229.1 hypothetical protein VOLCADRAFT_92271 [Volvox carteri f. nagariensis]|eukprot:XP_002951778.1 hypothetical protein VOLCADRAFT_92271 [Volvox carteri f. nagariensis]